MFLIYMPHLGIKLLFAMEKYKMFIFYESTLYAYYVVMMLSNHSATFAKEMHLYVIEISEKYLLQSTL